jgi:hypothetical protein
MWWVWVGCQRDEGDSRREVLEPGERLLADEAYVALQGEPSWLLGMRLGAGRDAHGDVWLAASGDLLLSGVLAARQPGGYELHITARPDELFGVAVEIGAFDGLYAPIVAAAHYDPGFIGLYGERPEVDFEQVVAEVARDERTLAGYPGQALRAADLDSDGHDELILSAPAAALLRVLDGPVQRYWSTELVSFVGDGVPGGGLGTYLGEPADMDGDGVLDLLAASDSGEGSTWVIDGSARGEVPLTEAMLAHVRGEAVGDDAGSHPQAGDADGDGHLDLLASSILAQERAGVAYLVLGPLEGEMAFADAEARVVGEEARDGCGAGTAWQRDLDEDGADDIVVGCPRDWYFGGDLPGRVQLYRGLQARGILGLAEADISWMGSHPGDFVGFGLEAGWDLTGDGTPDLAVGAPGESAVYVLPGPL